MLPFATANRCVTRVFPAHCQNSTTSGAMRYPPQFGAPATRVEIGELFRASSGQRLPAGRPARQSVLTGGDAQAGPACEPRGRLGGTGIGGSASASTLVTGPRTCSLAADAEPTETSRRVRGRGRSSALASHSW